MKRKIIVQVKPNKSQIKVALIGKNLFQTDLYEINLTKVPIDNACNEQLILVLSKYFKIASRKISITQGHKSRTKVLEIEV